MLKFLITATIAALPLAAYAQEDHSMAGHGAGGSALPAACDAAGALDTSETMPGMSDAMTGMDEVQKANHEAMLQMHGPMVKAAMIKDPDLAFNCGMIAHHLGAIAMSEVELKMGKDEASRTMARMIIDAQKKEIEEMTARVEAIANQGGNRQGG